MIACTDILGNEGRHGLHQGAGDQHCKVDNFTGDTIAGGGFQAEAVDKGAEGEERKLGQKFLQGERKSDGLETLLHWELKPEDPLLPMWKGSCFLKQHDNHRKDNADRLCKYGCKCCGPTASMCRPATKTRSPTMLTIHATKHEQERRFAVAKSAEDRRQKVVGDDEENTCCRRYEHNLWSESTASAGACMSTEMGRAKKTIAANSADRKQCEYNRRAADDRSRSVPGFFSPR